MKGASTVSLFTSHEVYRLGQFHASGETAPVGIASRLRFKPFPAEETRASISSSYLAPKGARLLQQKTHPRNGYTQV